MNDHSRSWRAAAAAIAPARTESSPRKVMTCSSSRRRPVRTKRSTTAGSASRAAAPERALEVGELDEDGRGVRRAERDAVLLDPFEQRRGAAGAGVSACGPVGRDDHGGGHDRESERGDHGEAESGCRAPGSARPPPVPSVGVRRIGAAQPLRVPSGRPPARRERQLRWVGELGVQKSPISVVRAACWGVAHPYAASLPSNPLSGSEREEITACGVRNVNRQGDSLARVDVACPMRCSTSTAQRFAGAC